MKPIRLALIQPEWTGNQDTMMQQYHNLFDSAKDQSIDIVALPEFSILPYFPGKRDPSGYQWSESLAEGVSSQFFARFAQQYGVTVIGSLYEKTEDGQHFDTATIHSPDGNLIHHTRKVHIPSGEGYHETDFFRGADDFPVHELEKVKISVPTCYDQWFPELARICTLNGAEMIYYPTAIGSEPTAPDFDSQDTWQTVMRGHAVANGIFVAACNRIGKENDVTFYGSSFICDPTGKIIAQASRDKAEVIIADLNPTIMEQYRTLFPLLHQRKPLTYNAILQSFEQDLPARWKEEPSFKDTE